jgi:hypothetical protein
VEVLGLAIVLFASTNVDDLFVLVAFFVDPGFRHLPSLKPVTQRTFNCQSYFGLLLIPQERFEPLRRVADRMSSGKAILNQGGKP